MKQPCALRHPCPGEKPGIVFVFQTLTSGAVVIKVADRGIMAHLRRPTREELRKLGQTLYQGGHQAYEEKQA